MRTPAGIHVQWVEDEAVVLNENTNELHYLNPQSALIYALLLEHGMPDALLQAFDRIRLPREQVEIEVEKLIESLTERGLLVEENA